MKILDRYLAGAVIIGTLVTLGVLLPLMGFFLLADEMDEVGENGYQLADALLFVALIMPRHTYQLFPIATLIGALVGLGSLASRSELVAIRAAGVSIGYIVYAAIKGGLLLALVAVAVGEGVAPIAEQKALQWRSEAQSGQVTLKSEHGFWARDGRAYIYIQEILSGAQLRDIHIYEFDEERHLSRVTRAEHAGYVKGSWILQGIFRSTIDNERIKTSHLAQADWNSLLDPGLLKIIVVEPHVLPIWGLLRYVRYMAANGQDARPYEVVFWGKAIHPFLIPAMIFVSIPILVGSARTSGFGARMLLGVVVGIAFYLVSRTFAYFALLYGMNPLVATLIPPLAFLAVAFWVLKRAG
ncbi:LPS export ABC transporter permease LptG [Candidatus Thiosymbion oneisti]|uniref:LPS export ABC transporter permease LptG n=1 Tax=Candidatus Thiosymbion oneisti TaxID=589554 RepID=UPI000B7F8656|nr:LPS export ABC transporter permease LptG [Candidatus Thiosymbion oneisti]